MPRYTRVMVVERLDIEHAASDAAQPNDEAAAARKHEWLGRRGAVEPSPYATMTPAERIQLVWPITVSAWAFSGKPYDESRLRRDVECLGRRGR